MKKLSMYDRGLLSDLLFDIIDATTKIESRCCQVSSSDDFLEDENSLILLDSICMQLIAIGQGIKDVDKLTNKTLFLNYPDIPWRNIAGIRDILSHNYFDLNAETVFGICQENISDLKKTLISMQKNID